MGCVHPGMAARYASTGASPSPRAICGLPPERSRGVFVGEGFVAEIDFGNTIRRWLINPFRFFAQAFGTDGLPKPDTTTMVGRRIFYSHVDGDGWRNQSEVKLDDRKASAAEVLYDRIATRFSDLPVTAWESGVLTRPLVPGLSFTKALIEPALAGRALCQLAVAVRHAQLMKCHRHHLPLVNALPPSL